MEEKIRKKLDRVRKWNKLQVFCAIMLFVSACIDFYFGRIDVALWMLVLGCYCLLLYRTNVREDALLRDFLECLDNNEYFYDYNRLLRAQVDMLEGKLSKEDFEKKVFEFNDKHKVYSNNEITEKENLK